MSRQAFAVEKALRILKENTDFAQDNAVDLLFGTGAPGGDAGEQDAAFIGSLYMKTDSGGGLFKKILNTGATSDWVEFGSADETRTQLTGVVASPEVLDSVLVDDVLASEWEIHIEDEAVPANKEVIKIWATHNGHSGADATTVDDTAYAKLKLGSSISTVLLIELNGAAAAQVMRLSVTGQVGGVTFTARRNDVKAP